MPPAVVHDTTLLWTRKLVLEQAGFSARTLVGPEALEVAAEKVLILCYTLSAAEKVAAAERYLARVPDGRILVLGADMQKLGHTLHHTLSTYPGPERFIQRVRELATAPEFHA